MRSPNNILGLEYVRALLRLNSPIKPFTIERTGGGYHSLDAPEDSFASAAAIRRILFEAAQKTSLGDTPSSLLHGLVPETLVEPVLCALRKYSVPSRERFDLLLHYALTHADRTCSLTEYLDVTEELASRIRKNLKDYETAEQFTSLVCARNFPASRVRRALLHVLLDIRREEAVSAHTECCASYARILGFRLSASDLMHKIKKTCSFPLITKPSSASELLDDRAMYFFKQDLYASAIYGMLFPGIKKENEYPRSPIIL